MPKLNARTWSIVSGLLLSTALLACAPHPQPPANPVPDPIAVPIKDTPPAELTRCAERPQGLPEDPDLIAQIPTKVRAGIIRLARSFGANADQLNRLVNWNKPGACPAPAPDR